MTGNSDDEINFPHEFLLTNRQVVNLRRPSANKSSTNIKSSNARLSKMIQSVGFLIWSITKNRSTSHLKCD